MSLIVVDEHYGDDEYHNGSMQEPLKSLRKALDISKSGDRILLNNGTYTKTNFQVEETYTLSISGNSGNSILDENTFESRGNLFVNFSDIKIRYLTAKVYEDVYRFDNVIFLNRRKFKIYSDGNEGNSVFKFNKCTFTSHFQIYAECSLQLDFNDCIFMGNLPTVYVKNAKVNINVSMSTIANPICFNRGDNYDVSISTVNCNILNGLYTGSICNINNPYVKDSPRLNICSKLSSVKLLSPESIIEGENVEINRGKIVEIDPDITKEWFLEDDVTFVFINEPNKRKRKDFILHLPNNATVGHRISIVTYSNLKIVGNRGNNIYKSDPRTIEVIYLSNERWLFY